MSDEKAFDIFYETLDDFLEKISNNEIGLTPVNDGETNGGTYGNSLNS